jgi:hypothetical protein
MTDTYSSYNTTAHNTSFNSTAYNTNGSTTVKNTLAVVTVGVVSPDNTNNFTVQVHDSGLMEFHDAQGNLVRSRQKTLRQFVEKMIASGLAT